MPFAKELRHLLFLDIETVGCVRDYTALSDRMKALWDIKTGYLAQPGESPEAFFRRKAGLLAEFGKVVCIGLGYFHPNDDQEPTLRLKVLSGDDEPALLEAFDHLLSTRFDLNKVRFVAHNGKEFDYPYLCRRMLIHHRTLPKPLDLSNKKGWEVPHLDTMEMWGFGDRRYFASLALLAEILGIPSSKEELDGSMTHEVYYEGEGLPRIAGYCIEDVILTARVYLRLRGLPELPESHIFRV